MHINTGKIKINRKSENNSQAKTILKTKFRISTKKKKKYDKERKKFLKKLRKRREKAIFLSACLRVDYEAVE